MIVDPDFFDHWRTGMVADAIGDPMAPIYIMRLWAHCQERKSDTFTMPAAGIKAQCKCPAPADQFEAALTEAGFLARDGVTVTVLGWAEKNASLMAAWENGAKGGRPRKTAKKTQEEPTGNPRVTHGKPTGNPAVTHGQPMGEPIREEKIYNPLPPAGGAAAAQLDLMSDEEGEGSEAAQAAEEVEAKAKDKAQGIPPCPYREFAETFNRVLPQLPQVRSDQIGDGRKRKMAKLWRIVMTTKRRDGEPRATNAAEALQWLADYFALALDDDFLMGRTGRGAGHEGWRPDIDYFCTERAMTRLLEK